MMRKDFVFETEATQQYIIIQQYITYITLCNFKHTDLNKWLCISWNVVSCGVKWLYLHPAQEMIFDSALNVQ